MRKSLILVVVALLSLTGGRAVADAAPQAAPNNGPPKLWVPVFAETGNVQSPSWVAKTVRQALLDELGGLRSIEVMSADVTPKDAASAVVEAKNAGATYVVTATCQVVD